MALNILIVDDSAISRQIIARCCQLSGAEIGEIHYAENGAEALKLLDSLWIDIILTDINMPVMDGIDFIRQLKRSANLGNIPVVVISTEGGFDRIRHLVDQGVIAYIRKPFTPEQIAAVMLRIMGAHDEL
jgi:two-component system, chemotaxis family, chemotaxis protein CheY